MGLPESNDRLLIKFLGAGNFVAMSDVIDKNTILVSVASNQHAIENFLKPKACFYIDDSNFLSLAITSMSAILFVCKGRFNQVVNLETESNFSKLLTTLAGARETLGLTNTHKSYLDAFIYDRYLVNPIMVSKSDSIRLLVDFQLVTNRHALASIKESQEEFLSAVRFHGPITKIVFAPSGSDTNRLRRLKDGIWQEIADKLFKKYPDISIDIIFPGVDDWQYQPMKLAFGARERCAIRIGSYSDYLNILTSADLIVCIDSQTLHISSQLGVPTVCFFGPTSPYGVKHASTVYPISKAGACSPCMHKYFSVPCKNKAVCMDFEMLDLNIFDRLDSLYA